ncbi:class I SAM-dependent methyltransferase [Candidatus Nitrotoga arctica]|uniref:Methyltransferase domain-containing protein n=1 Tax=Candidatus Nitrotoga arctica TaxID=453162 RepID=A0ABM8YYY7_9PROT|nr:class I SAM-dependent methyltransferase [Candidatus Nitrotoga arctica]CAG9932795.1 conserved protein of unknown function [Candidatus Nitrotoga arctica]
MTGDLYRCRICHVADKHAIYLPREMMFGTKEEFEYFQCSSCGCLQISEIPADIARFYPSNYYSMNPQEQPLTQGSVFRMTMERLRVGNALFGRNYKLAKLASYIVDMPYQLNVIGPWLKKCQIQSFKARFLDVGCGSASGWLHTLKQLGFKNLLGVDPYIEKNVNVNGINIMKQHIDQTAGPFDLVSLHHSLEHIPNQTDALKAVNNILTPGGFCLVRIPLVSSLVWEQYGTDWVELDAPRHFYLHSLKSIKLAGEQAGFNLVDNCWDSTEFEFWGSEQYRRGLPLMSDTSFMRNPALSNFTYREMTDFRARAESANKEGRGGRGCFFFQKS